jgi:hypothetical protein
MEYLKSLTKSELTDYLVGLNKDLEKGFGEGPAADIKKIQWQIVQKAVLKELLERTSF